MFTSLSLNFAPIMAQWLQTMQQEQVNTLSPYPECLTLDAKNRFLKKGRRLKVNNNSLVPSPNKNLGQHYLNNQATIEKICEDFNGLYDGIIEIGPGPGTFNKNTFKETSSSYSHRKRFKICRYPE